MNQATQATETKDVKPPRPAAPEGFVYNAEGNLIARCNIPAHELRKDAFTGGLVEQVKDQQRLLKSFKANLVKAFEEFRIELLDQFNAKLHARGSGENVTVYSFDGKYKIAYRTTKLKTLGPELAAARELAREWFNAHKDSAPHDMLLPAQEFYSNDMTVTTVVKFIGWKVQDPTLVEAQSAAKDALLIIGSKSYFNFYERDEQGEYQPIHLNFSKL